MKVIFDVLHLYYLPQYLPVLHQLQKQGYDVRFVFYKQAEDELNLICEKIALEEKLNVTWVDGWNEAFDFYLDYKADWIVFGNKVSDIDQIHTVSKTVLMQHGIGPKRCYYQVSENLTTVRFIEGQHRLNRLLSLYPDGNFVDTGYAKLDPILKDFESKINLTSLGLDESKPTILYAPTFYPSSIECFSQSFAKDFSDYNIIVKPHFFSLTKKKYNKQRKLLKHWAQFDNVYIAKLDDYNLIPFMGLSDVMLSDASSAIFEFAALDKPVVWCDFYKLRWSYRGIFSYRFKRRIDSDIEYFNAVASKATSYKEIQNAINEAQNLSNSDKELRKTTIQKLAGLTDGLCSERIVKYLMENK